MSRTYNRNSTRNEAKEYSQYLHINDSIKKVRQQAKNQFAKIKYDFKKEKDENIELKAQKLIQHQEQKKKLTTLFYNDNCFGFGFIYYYLVQKKRKKIKTIQKCE
jgi:hypothetical protein